MKARRIDSTFKIIIKAGLLFSWSLFMLIANTQNWLTEVFLLSVAIGLLSFFAFYNKPTEKTGIISNKKGHINTGPNREQYLNVFLFSK